MVHPIRVSKHKVSGALKVVSDQCALDYSKTEKRQQKFFVSAQNGLKKKDRVISSQMLAAELCLKRLSFRALLASSWLDPGRRNVIQEKRAACRRRH